MLMRMFYLMSLIVGLLCVCGSSLACSYQNQACGNGFCVCPWDPVKLNNHCTCSDPKGDQD